MRISSFTRTGAARLSAAWLIAAVLFAVNLEGGEPKETKPAAEAKETQPAAAPAETKPAETKTESKEPPPPFEAVTDEEIKKIDFEDATNDRDIVTPFAPNHEHLDEDARKQLNDWIAKLDDWPAGKEAEVGQKVRNWVYLTTIPDIVQSQFEAEVPIAIFERLQGEIVKEKLIKALAWVVLKPEDGTVVTGAKELELDVDVPEQEVRGRGYIYAKKMLGRLLGKLPKKEE